MTEDGQSKTVEETRRKRWNFKIQSMKSTIWRSIDQRKMNTTTTTTTTTIIIMVTTTSAKTRSRSRMRR